MIPKAQTRAPAMPRSLVGAKVFGDRLRLEIRDAYGDSNFFFLRLSEPAPARLEGRHGAACAPIALDDATRQAIGEALSRARQAAGIVRERTREHAERQREPLTATLGAIAAR